MYLHKDRFLLVSFIFIYEHRTTSMGSNPDLLKVKETQIVKL